MKYRIILTSKMSDEVKSHILSDRSREQMAIVLCGVNHLKKETRLIGRHLILLPPAAYSKQTSAYLEVSDEVQREILRMAADEGLSQVDFHSHPGESPNIGFSGTDDYHEQKLGHYLTDKIPGSYYASIVMNNNAFDARVWEINGRTMRPKAVSSVRWGDFDDKEPASITNNFTINSEVIDERFSRQVIAFGNELSKRLRQYRIGIVGVGGTGGIIVEMLARLGVTDWVLIDDDIVEISNLNRLPGSTQKDVHYRTFKVNVAHRNIVKTNQYAQVRKYSLPVSDQKALQALKSCDLIIVATDNHSSRLIVNRLSVQYLIPLVHVGVNIEVDEERKITDISAEYVVPYLGKWCLQCINIIDTQMAGWELADKDMRSTLREHGYIKNTPAPAVYHLNGVIASLAASEIHNLMFPYKGLNRYLTYDALKGELLTLNTLTKNECPLCNGEAGILGLGDLEPLPDYVEKIKSMPPSDQYDAEYLENPDIEDSSKDIAENILYSMNFPDERQHNDENT